MKPVLFNSTETAFITNGIGILSDAISCKVIQELNGKYELEMKYPITGLHFENILRRSIIQAKADPVSELQPFRVYKITKPSSGVVTVKARPLAYDLKGIAVAPFAAVGAASALAGLKENAVVECPFSFSTDKGASGAFKAATPAAIWSLLGGTEGSILDTYGGEYEFDRYSVKLWNRRGADRGVSIRYGKNLTSLEQDENCANCYTGIYPFWADAEGNLVQLSEKVVNAPGTFDYVKILPVDFSADFDEAPSEDALRTRSEKYISDNDIGTPTVSWKVEFVQLEQTEEYKGKALLERVLLGDTVSVEFEQMGVSASARVVAVDYDCILERYNSATLGSVKANIADVIVQQAQEAAKKPSLSLVQQISMHLAAAILGAHGGSARLLDTDGDGMPDELYLADNKDPALAVKVWRFNYKGWAASKTGYNGPFIFGATLEDGILASAITAANLIAGTITSKDGTTFFLDLDNGILKGKFSEFSISGKTVDQIAQEKADAAETDAINAATAAAATDATNKANAAKSAAISAAQTDATAKANDALSTAKAYTDALNVSLAQAEIFNRLTNNGTLPGLFMQDGQLFINASYLKTGTVAASLIDVANLVVQYLTSTAGDSTLNITGAVLSFLYGGRKTAWLTNEYSGQPIFYMQDVDPDYEANWAEFSPHHMKIGGTSVSPKFQVTARGDYSKMDVDAINPGKKTLFSGTCAIGGTCSVPGTSYYDLFAVRLGTSSSDISSVVVLAYKVGSDIRGVGGWAGTDSLNKELYLMTATCSGDTWTLVDAGRHDVYSYGGVSSDTELVIREIRGII